MWQITTARDSSSSGSKTFFWLPWVPDMRKKRKKKEKKEKKKETRIRRHVSQERRPHVYPRSTRLGLLVQLPWYIHISQQPK